MRTITKRIAQAGAAVAMALTTAVTMTGQANATETLYAEAWTGTGTSGKLVAQGFYSPITNNGYISDRYADGYGVYIQFQEDIYGVWANTRTYVNNKGAGQKVSFTYTPYYRDGDVLRMRVCRNSATGPCSSWKYGVA
ncbi:hypothetical protein [Embleya hyalina]|uniref:Secreted protein n=1 Tax=Embleya hyalina TaxID=516124 RepID=A0A401Z339_9ACTN|nr:hypothetical protein [Embleya hyalina]GCE01269.1 hypothetical protein EHYA_09033 [Embleya hyalina]